MPLERIAFIASHAGNPGQHASQAVRSRWGRAQRQVGDLGPRLGHLLPEWTRGLLGRLDGELIDLSAGCWRERKYDRLDQWPAVNPRWERRKFLARTANGSWLLKFAGLGHSGEAKLERARALHEEGFTAGPLGLVHGFIVEQWYENGMPLGRGDRPIREIGRYLRARLRHRAASSGASPFELYEMARINLQGAFGAEWATAIRQWEPHLPRLARQVRPVETDNRMDRQEWLRLSDGCLLKSDALDHCVGHDLIGCQDITWDVAGAILELELDERQSAELCSCLGNIEPDLLRFLTLAYLAFRLGQSAISVEMCVADPIESARFRARFDVYAARLRIAMDVTQPSVEAVFNID